MQDHCELLVLSPPCELMPTSTSTQPEAVEVAAVPRPLRMLAEMAAARRDVMPLPTSPYGQALVVNRPDLVKQVLTGGNYLRPRLLSSVIGDGLAASEGAHWQRQRQLLQPGFPAELALSLAPLIERETAAALDRWSEQAAGGRAVEVSKELSRLLLRITIAGLLGGRPDDRIDDLCTAVRTATDHLGRAATALFGVPLQLTTQSTRRFEDAKNLIDQYVRELVAGRRNATAAADETRAGDPLALLLQAGTPDGRPVGDKTLRDEAATLLIAGHDNTATMLSWAFHLLASRPTLQDAMRDEARRLGECELSVRQAQRLELTGCVLRESLRLYPPVWQLTRKACAAEQLGGFDVEPGAAVVVSPYAMHRRPDIWEQPDRFEPQRFAPPAAAEHHGSAYFPFGAGPHACIGRRLALAQGVFVLSAVLARFRLHPSPGEDVAPEPALNLRVHDGLRLRIEPNLEGVCGLRASKIP